MHLLKPTSSFRALSAALLAACVAHCAPPPETSSHYEPSPSAALEVSNRTQGPVEVAVGGWTLGTVGAGSRARFRALRSGRHRVTARDARRGKPWTQTLQFTRGEVSTWEVLPRDGQATAPPPAFGSALLVNVTGRDLDIRFESEEAHTLLSGDTRRVDDLLAGQRSLEVRVPGTRYVRNQIVNVTAGARSRHEVQIEAGMLAITNRTGESVRLFIDNRERRVVRNGISTTLDGLVVGVHKLRAVGTRTGKLHFRTIRIAHKTTLRWDLSATQGQLVLRNLTGETLTLSLDGQDRGKLAHGKSLRITDAKLGRRSVVARGLSTSHRWSADVPLSAGHEIRWAIRDDTGTLRIQNGLQESIEVRVGQTVLGTVAPGKKAFFGDLPGGKQTISVFGAISRVIQRRKSSVSPERSVVWNVSAPLGRLHVRNRTAESVMVYADQRPLGRVASGEQLVFTQVPPGNRLLEARGETTGDTNRARRDVSVRELIVWDVATSTGKIGVKNESGEPLVAPPGLQPQGKVLASGERRVYLIPIGHRIIHFIGRTSGQSYFSRFTVSTQKQQEWVIPQLSGLIHVYNRTSESHTLQIDGATRGTVAAGKQQLVRLPVGPHRLVAVGEKTKNATEGTVVVRSKVTHPWEVRPDLAYIQIINNTRETLDLRVDGGVLGRVAPNASVRFGPWPVRPVSLSAQGRWSKAIYEAKVQLVAGRMESWEVEAARGVVQVLNRRPEVVRILIDGTEKARVEAGKTQELSLPLGTHRIELVGAESHAIFSQRLRVRPDRTYTVHAPKGPAQLHVVNRLAIPLVVTSAERQLGTVPAGGEARFELSWLGSRTFLAKPATGGPAGTLLKWHRRLNIDSDRVFQWEIAP